MDSTSSISKVTSLWVPVLSLIVAALSLILSGYFAYRDKHLAELYLSLDLQQKRPFLAPMVQAKKVEGDQRYYWSWGAQNSGSVIARLLYVDYREKRFSSEKWSGSGMVRDEIIYPKETLEFYGELGELSGLAVICVVYEEVGESGKGRRWTGFAQYIFTKEFEILAKSGMDPHMKLVHRTEESTAPEVTSCNAIEWWRNIPTVSTGKPNSNAAKK